MSSSWSEPHALIRPTDAVPISLILEKACTRVRQLVERTLIAREDALHPGDIPSTGARIVVNGAGPQDTCSVRRHFGVTGHPIRGLKPVPEQWVDFTGAFELDQAWLTEPPSGQVAKALSGKFDAAAYPHQILAPVLIEARVIRRTGPVRTYRLSIEHP